MARSSGDECAAAVAEALAPYAWREFTDQMLARRIVGAVDRSRVLEFLSSLPGADVGDVDPMEPAELGDERVAVLVRALDGQSWRGWALARLCTDLSSELEAWQAVRDSFDSDLRRLLGGH